jgi:hypothetical protein
MTMATCVVHESLGNNSPSMVSDLYKYLKTYKWYHRKHLRKRNRPRASKRYAFKLRAATMIFMYASRSNDKQIIHRIPTVMAIELDKYGSEGVLEVDRDNYALSITNHVRIETDSVPIKVDNCCTQTITGYESDFIPSTIRKVEDKQVCGFGRSISKITHQGTIRWRVYDDHGKEHDIIIPNTYFVPNCGLRLLSPQHWAQELNDNYPMPDGTSCTTYYNRVVLQWNQRKTVKTLHIDSNRNNVATMWTVGSLRSYNKTMKLANMTQVVMDSEIIEKNGDTEDVEDENSPEYTECDIDKFENFQHLGNEQVVIRGTTSRSHDSRSSEDELMQWHVRFGHMPMSRIQSLAKEGVLPRRLSSCKIPVCPGCMYGKLTRQPWRVRGETSHIAEKAQLAGDCISQSTLFDGTRIDSATEGNAD